MGRVTSDNLYGLSQFIVDPSSAKGAYNTIQDAYNAADAAGGGTIFIHPVPGASYSENLVLNSANPISFIGVQGDATSTNNLVNIGGTAAFTGAGPHTFQDIFFIGVVDAAFDFSGVGIMQASFQNCNISSFVGIGLKQTGGDLTLKMLDSYCTGATYGMSFVGNTLQGNFTNCLIGSSAGDAISTMGVASDTIQCFGCTLNATGGYGWNGQGTSALYFNQGMVTSGAFEAFNIGPLAFARAFNCQLLTSAASGFTVTGTGQFLFDSIISEANVVIDPALTRTPLDWKPYAQAALAPATPTAGQGLRGTSCFDNVQFTVTDGFVQGVFSGLFPWIYYPIINTMPANSGAFIEPVGVDVNLPTAPPAGTVAKIVVMNGASPASAIAGGTDLIQIGNFISTAGGTATSTLDGDSLSLVYSSTDTTWYATSSVGSWVLA